MFQSESKGFSLGYHHPNPSPHFKSLCYCKAPLKLQDKACLRFSGATGRNFLSAAAQTTFHCSTKPRSLCSWWTIPGHAAKKNSKQLLAVWKMFESLKHKHTFTHILSCPLKQVILLQLRTVHFPRRSKKAHLIHLFRIVYQNNISDATMW